MKVSNGLLSRLDEKVIKRPTKYYFFVAVHSKSAPDNEWRRYLSNEKLAPPLKKILNIFMSLKYLSFFSFNILILLPFEITAAVKILNIFVLF